MPSSSRRVRSRGRRRVARVPRAISTVGLNSGVRIRGRSMVDLSYSASFSFNVFNFEPSSIVRLDLIRTVFEQYRVNMLKFTGMPTGTSGNVAMGWLSGSQTTTPSGWNISYVANLEPSVIHWAGKTVPSVIQVTSAKIHNSRTWFSTNDTNGPIGLLVVGGSISTAVAAVICVEYDLSFCSPIWDNKEEVQMSRGVNTVAADEPVIIAPEQQLAQMSIYQPPPPPLSRLPSRSPDRKG